MESSSKLLENQNPSPNSHSAISTTSSTTTCSNGLQHPPQPQTPTTPKPITRSEPNSPYPTTFVQADTFSFKQVVQMLTGSPQTKPDPPKNPIPPIRTGPKKQPSSKLYERRNSLNKGFKISPLLHPGSDSGLTRNTHGILSPSVLDFPSLALSPVTPLIPDPFNRSPHPGLDMEREKDAIEKKGFYLHPSPASTPRESEPRLLPLFPVTSPRISGSSS